MGTVKVLDTILQVLALNMLRMNFLQLPRSRRGSMWSSVSRLLLTATVQPVIASGSWRQGAALGYMHKLLPSPSKTAAPS